MSRSSIPLVIGAALVVYALHRRQQAQQVNGLDGFRLKSFVKSVTAPISKAAKYVVPKQVQELAKKITKPIVEPVATGARALNKVGRGVLSTVNRNKLHILTGGASLFVQNRLMHTAEKKAANEARGQQMDYDREEAAYKQQQAEYNKRKRQQQAEYNKRKRQQKKTQPNVSDQTDPTYAAYGLPATMSTNIDEVPMTTLPEPVSEAVPESAASEPEESGMSKVLGWGTVAAAFL